MHSPILVFLSASLGLATMAQAQQRDDTTTRAFTKVAISVNGQYLTASSDTRDARPPVSVSECSTCYVDRWDVVTSGKHNDKPGYALIVDTLTQKCLTFDPERANGRQVYMSPCGGNTDGSGGVLTSQLFENDDRNQGAMKLQPLLGRQNGQCLSPSDGYLAVGGCDASRFNVFEFFKRGPVSDN